MPAPKLIAIVTALLLISGHSAFAEYSLPAAGNRNVTFLTKNNAALILLLQANPALMVGDDPLAIELRAFMSASSRRDLLVQRADGDAAAGRSRSREARACKARSAATTTARFIDPTTHERPATDRLCARPALSGRYVVGSGSGTADRSRVRSHQRTSDRKRNVPWPHHRARA